MNTFPKLYAKPSYILEHKNHAFLFRNVIRKDIFFRDENSIHQAHFNRSNPPEVIDYKKVF